MTQRHDSTSNPADAGCNSDLAQYSNTPSLRVAGFEDSLSDEAHGLCCLPLEVGLASEARSTIRRWRSRKDEYEVPGDEIGQLREGANHL